MPLSIPAQKSFAIDNRSRSSALSQMNSFFSKFLVFILIQFLLCLSSAPLHAQTTSQPQSTTGSTHRLKFSVYPIGKADWKGIYYQATPGNYQALSFWSYERSPRHDYKGPVPIEFYRKFENPDPEGEPIYKVVASSKLSSSSEEYLLFFVAIGGNQKGTIPDESFQIVPLDDSHLSFPLETVTFVNATGVTLEGVFANKPIYLKPGVSAPYALKEFFQQETLIGLAVEFEGTLKKVMHSKWTFYPNYREIILLLPPKKADSLRIQAFRITQHKEEISPPAAATERES